MCCGVFRGAFFNVMILFGKAFAVTELASIWQRGLLQKRRRGDALQGVSDILALMLPLLDGAKTTAKLQLAPPARGVPLQPSSASVNAESPVSVTEFTGRSMPHLSSVRLGPMGQPQGVPGICR